MLSIDLNKVFLRNRNFALLCLKVLYVSINITGLHHVFDYCSVIRARAFAAYIALSIEKGATHNADNLIKYYLSGKQKNKWLISHVLYLLVDKKYQIDWLVELTKMNATVLTFDNDVEFEFVVRLIFELSESNPNLVDDEIAALLIRAIRKDKLDSSRWNLYIKTALQKTVMATHPQLISEIRTKLGNDNRLVIKLNFTEYLLKNDCDNVLFWGKKYLNAYPNDLEALDDYCSALFMSGQKGLLLDTLRQATRKLSLAGKQRRNQAKFKDSFLKLGLLSYSYGDLEYFRASTAGMYNVTNFYRKEFNAALVLSGPIYGYTFLRVPVDTIMSNYKDVNYQIIEPGQIHKFRDKSIVFINNVNALCNQFMFSFTYDALSADLNFVSISCDHRLFEVFSRSFSQIKFLPLNKAEAKESSLPDSKKMLLNQQIKEEMRHADVVSTVPLNVYLRNSYFYEIFRKQKAWLKTSSKNDDKINSWLLDFADKPTLGISIGSGSLTFRRKKYVFTYEDFKEISPSLQSFHLINLDYHRSEDELEEARERSGLKVLQPPVDLKDDLDLMLSLLKCIDGVICTPNNIMDMCASVNTKVIVLDTTGQMKEWSQSGNSRYIYSDSVTFHSPTNSSVNMKRDLIADLPCIIADSVLCDT